MKNLIDFIQSEWSKAAQKFIRVLVNCAKNIPERFSIYSSLVGLLNMRDPAIGAKFVEELVREMKECFSANSFDDIRYLLRFLADCTNCGLVDPGSMLAMLETFSEVPGEAYSTSQARADWYAYIVLYCLPHCAKVLNKHDSKMLNSILVAIRMYLSRRTKRHVRILRVWDSEAPPIQEDYLDLLSVQIENLQEAGWQEDVSWRLHHTLPSLHQHGSPHSFFPISPPDFDSSVVYPMPRVCFRLFDYMDVIDPSEDADGAVDADKAAVLPGAHTIERFLIDDELQIILDTCNYNRVQCARSLLGLRCQAKIALDYMIIEQVLGSMLQLPQPGVSHGRLLFYGSLLIQLCNESSANVPLVLAQATEIMFERLDHMKPACIERLVAWFAYHLTNYQLQWSWRDWSGALLEDRMSPRRRLIVETLALLGRFSYHDNVRRRLPRSFHVLMPSEPGFCNRYGGAGATRLVGSPAFSKVLAAVRSRMDADELSELIQRATKKALALAEGADRMDDNDMEEGIEETKPSGSPGRDSSASDGESNARRMDDTPHGLPAPVGTSGVQSSATPVMRRDDDTPHGLSSLRASARRMDDTPHGLDALPRNKFDDEDDVVNYDQVMSARKELDARQRLVARRKLREKSEDENAVPGQARNASPPRELAGARQLELCAGVEDLNIDVFVSALLFCGHKTISHTFSLVERYSNVLRRLVPLGDLRAQVDCLHIARAAWARQPQMFVLIACHLCRTGIVEGAAVIRWAYSDQMTCFQDQNTLEERESVPPMLEYFVWECIDAVLKRTGRQVRKLTDRLEDAKDALALRRSGSSSGSSSSDSDSDSSADRGGPRGRSRSRSVAGGSSAVVARLNRERALALETQAGCVSALLRSHAAFMTRLETEPPETVPKETLTHVNFWLRGRLEQMLLEHHEQFTAHLDSLEEVLNSEANCPTVRSVLDQWRALTA